MARRASTASRGAPNGLYFGADTTGAIWQFDLPSKKIELWIRDDLLKATGSDPLGANGIKVHDNWVYVSVTGRNAVYRVRIGADGKPSGGLTLVGQGFRPDDFAVTKDGSVYGFGAGTAGLKENDRPVLYRISPTGEVTKFFESAPHGRRSS